ncbi:MAG TPA: SRPBCC family protein [Vicinamibacteria bacterium]|jgi:hypothetical protein|nr:SRPBCC family protein [Vicinamibacteria bacterium]
MMQPILLLGALAMSSPSPEPFVPARLTRSYTQHLDAPPGVVFPLLGPVQEKQWAHGWDPAFVYPPGGVDERGCVFMTGGGASVWILTVFDAPGLRVGYVQVTPGVRVAELSITLAPAGTTGTVAVISYTWTALSAKSNEFMEAHRGPLFEEGMREWEAGFNAYLRGRAKE